jgi:hypothetical protein
VHRVSLVWEHDGKLQAEAKKRDHVPISTVSSTFGCVCILRRPNVQFRPFAGEAERQWPVIEAAYVQLGASLAILLDWAIYTHLNAYLRIGFPSTPRSSWCEIAFGGSAALLRTLAVLATGMGAGLSFASKQASPWLVAAGLFVLTHSLLYAMLYMRKERL